MAEPVLPPPKNTEVVSPAPAKERTTEENEALAIGLLSKHPDWSKKRIAQHVGVNRRTLYNWPRFEKAWRIAKAKDTEGVARGSKGKRNRKVEAYSAAKKCDCGDLATQDYNGKDYCRACYLDKVLEDQEAEKRKDDEARKRKGGGRRVGNED